MIGRGGVGIMNEGEIPSAVLKVNTNAPWPDQSAGLLLSFCSSPLPCSSPFLPSLPPSLSVLPSFEFFSYPAFCFISFSAPFSFHHHSPSSILLLVTSPILPAVFSNLWIPSLFSLFTLMGCVRNDPRLYIEPFSLSLSQLHVRDCVHSTTQLSPNSP